MALDGESLVVRAGGNWSRVRPGRAGVAPGIHEALRHRGEIHPDAVCPDTNRRLLELGVLMSIEPASILDRAEVAGTMCAPLGSRETDLGFAGDGFASEDGEGWVVLAEREDPALSVAFGRLGARIRFVGLLCGRSVIVAHGAPGAGLGCARCAWLGERNQVFDVPPTPVDAAPPARAERAWLRARCAQLVDALLLGLEELPAGHAWVAPLGGVRRTEPIARHPACACWHAAGAVTDVSWETLEGRTLVHGPEYHLARVSGAAGERAYAELCARSTDATREAVDRWGPARSSSEGAGRSVEVVTSALRAQGLEAWVADRSLPELDVLRPTSDPGALLRVAIEAPGRWLPIALDAAVELGGPVRIVHANGAYPRSLAERARRAPHVFVPTVVLTHQSGTVSTLVPVPHAPPAEPVRVCASYERGRITARLPRGGAHWLALRAAGEVDERVLTERGAEPRDASVHARGMWALVERFVDTLDTGAPDLATLPEEVHLRAVWAAIWRATRFREGADV